MECQALCDCHFKEHCPTFNDPLVDDERRGPKGLGCLGQTDLYRGKHCQTFVCAYLSTVLSDALKNPLPKLPHGRC